MYLYEYVTSFLIKASDYKVILLLARFTLHYHNHGKQKAFGGQNMTTVPENENKEILKLYLKKLLRLETQLVI